MRMKILILLACFGMLVPAKVRADVDSIYFQFNQNGEIIDMGTTGADSETGDANDSNNEKGASIKGGDEVTSNEDVPAVSNETPVTRGLTKGAGDPLPDCTFDASGQTDGDCTCPDNGSLVAIGSKFVCCNMATAKRYVGGSYSRITMPYCGCDSTGGYRAPWSGSASVCCKNGYEWYNTINDDGTPTRGDANAQCSCPDDSVRVMKDGVEHCCRGLIDLATIDGGTESASVCGCVVEGNSACNQDLCSQTAGHAWCALNGDSGGWCHATTGSCETECVGKGYHWCAKTTELGCKDTEGDGSQVWNSQTCVWDNICSAAHPEACTTESSCWATTTGKWCYKQTCRDDCPANDSSCVACTLPDRCTYACGASDTDCTQCPYAEQECRPKGTTTRCCEGDNQQLAVDGKCYACPVATGHLILYGTGNAREVLCCNDKKQSYDAQSGAYTNNLKCGCPIVTDPNQSNRGQGQVKSGYCCLNGYAYSETTEAYTDATHFEECGCPDGGVWKSGTKTCCKEGKPFVGDSYSDSRNFEKCGCKDGESLKNNGKTGDKKIEVCCGGGHMFPEIPASTWDPEYDSCHCNPSSANKYYDKVHQACVRCKEDRNCSSRTATPHCYVDSQNPGENNKCVACTQTSHCSETNKEKFCLVNTSDETKRFTCTSCENNLHYDSSDETCHECVADSDCNGNVEGKYYCDVLTKTCQACKLQSRSSTQSYDSGCNPASQTGNPKKKYCASFTDVENVGSVRVVKTRNECVQCLSASDCAANEQCNVQTGLCEAGCSSDADCVDAGCQTCKTNDDCATGKECKNGVCADPCKTCKKSSECSSGNVCRRGVCVDPFSSYEGCPSDDPRYCRSQKCNKKTNLCQSQCISDTDCDLNESCNGGFCEEHCVEDSPTPVWDIYKRRCVHCYDSISEDWTDLGCPDNVQTITNIDPADYDPRSYVGDYSNRICLVRKDIPQGKCVECLKNSHCVGQRKCVGNRCMCESDEIYDTTHKRCVQCNTNYGDSTVGKKACPRSKPVCSSTTHTCGTCPSGQAYSVVALRCVECTSAQCIDADAADDGKICVTVADYLDVEKDTDGLCKKKNLTLSYSKTGTHTVEGSGIPYYCEQGRKLELELSSATIKLKYEHKVTITTDKADECTFGSNLTGEITQIDSDSCASTCAEYAYLCDHFKNDYTYNQNSGWVRSGAPSGCGGSNVQFKATAKVNPGTYQGVKVIFQDIVPTRYGMMGGTATIKFVDE